MPNLQLPAYINSVQNAIKSYAQQNKYRDALEACDVALNCHLAKEIRDLVLTWREKIEQILMEQADAPNTTIPRSKL